MVKNPPAMQETWVQSLGWEDPLEKRMANHSSILAWRIPGTGLSLTTPYSEVNSVLQVAILSIAQLLQHLRCKALAWPRRGPVS